MSSYFEYQRPARPLAEPPIFDYEKFVVEEDIPSDARLRRLFEKDIGMGYRYRDLKTELALLRTHARWAIDIQAEEVDVGRRAFYQGLKDELSIDTWSLESASLILKEARKRGVISDLGLWEYKYLDEDGGTTNICRRVNDGWNIFLYGFGGTEPSLCEPAYEKYGHLVPPGSKITQLIETRAKEVAEQRLQGLQGTEQSRENMQDLPPTASTNSAQSTSHYFSVGSVAKAQENSTYSFNLSHFDLNSAIPTSRPAMKEPEHHHPTPTPTTTKPQSSTPTIEDTSPSSHMPNLEQQLAASKSENAALKKRIADLELANSAAKKQKIQLV